MYRRGHSLPPSTAVIPRGNHAPHISRFRPVGNIQLTVEECNLPPRRSIHRFRGGPVRTIVVFPGNRKERGSPLAMDFRTI
jgi:hypothetical protein